jgi:hypothetical protein
MKFARIQDGVVFEIGNFDSIENRFHPSLVWVECPDEFGLGDLYDGTFSHPPAPVPPPLTVADYTNAVQRHLDAAAKAKGYDGILSAASYAPVPGMFQAEGVAFAQWRTSVWACCYGVMSAVEQQLRPAPTVPGLIAELPTLVLP